MEDCVYGMTRVEDGGVIVDEYLNLVHDWFASYWCTTLPKWLPPLHLL